MGSGIAVAIEAGFVYQSGSAISTHALYMISTPSGVLTAETVS